jgi:Ca-activated chloride channel homolog
VVTQDAAATGSTDAAATGLTPQARAHRRRRRGESRAERPRGVALAVVLALLLGLAAVAAWPPGWLPCLGERVVLKVAVAPSLGQPLRQAADEFGSDRPRVGRACVDVQVAVVAPQNTVTALGRSVSNDTTPGFDVWLPDTATWVTAASRRPDVANLLAPRPPVVASSPTVLAMPRPQAEALGWPKVQPSLAALVRLARDPAGWTTVGHPEWGKVKLAWTDPQADGPGLDSVMGFYRQAAGTDGDRADVQQSLVGLQSALRSVTVDRVAAGRPLSDPALTPDAAMRAAVSFPSSEQAVLAFNATSPKVPLAALYPSEGLNSSDVPFVRVLGKVADARRVTSAASLFADFLTGPRGGDLLRATGFRCLGPGPLSTTARGVVPSEPAFVPQTPVVESVARALQYWAALQERGNVLVVVDVSGSMLEPVPGLDVTRLDLARAAVADALAAYSDKTAVGLWAFSRRLDGDRDHQVVVPVAEARDKSEAVTRRARLRSSALALQAGGDTGLYDTAIAAFRDLRARSRPGKNLVVILSDGRNDDPGSASLAQVVSEVSGGQPAAQTVRIDTVAYGEEADAEALRAISRASKGRTYAARSPGDLRTVLLTALSASS